MFVGHLAVGLLGKRARPALSLGWYILAATLLDLIWPVLVLAGIERVSVLPAPVGFNTLVFDAYPWSHSLVMAVFWGLVLAALARRRSTAPTSGLTVWLLVVSHWVLDVITHVPDMPLWPGSSPKLGLGLWNSLAATYLFEGALWVAAFGLYLWSRPPHDGTGRVAFWSLVVVTTAIWASSPFATPPANSKIIALSALLGGLLTIPWAAWADRHHGPKGSLP